MSERPVVAIIGFGDFTRLMIRYLQPYCRILVASRRHIEPEKDLSFEQVDTVKALAQPIIIPSIPAQFLEAYFTSNAELVNPEALVIDVCSVKVKPVEVLERVLPPTVSILATHPMFGPASAAETTAGQRMMMHPVRLDRIRYEQIRDFLRDTFKLNIIECTPEEHDRNMAYVQGLSHYIGRLMQIMDIPETNLTTNAYIDLLDMKRIQGGDSWELFESIMFQNPYAMEVNHKFKQAIIDLDGRLGMQ